MSSSRRNALSLDGSVHAADSYVNAFSTRFSSQASASSAFDLPYDGMALNMADWTPYMPLRGTTALGASLITAAQLNNTSKVAYTQYGSSMIGLDISASGVQGYGKQVGDPLDISGAMWQEQPGHLQTPQQHAPFRTVPSIVHHSITDICPLGQNDILDNQNGRCDEVEFLQQQSLGAVPGQLTASGSRRKDNRSKVKGPSPKAKLVKAKQKGKKKEEPGAKWKKCKRRRRPPSVTITSTSPSSSSRPQSTSSHSIVAPPDAAEETFVAAWPGQVPTQPHNASAKQRKHFATQSKLIAPPTTMVLDEQQTPNTDWSATSFDFAFGTYPAAPASRSGTTASSPDFQCQLPSPNITSPAQSAAGLSGGVSQRARNRLAAMKYRAKTKATISQLEQEERDSSSQHVMLQAYVDMLRQEIWHLKNELLRHNWCDCVLIQQYIANTARLIGEEAGSSRRTNSHRHQYQDQVVDEDGDEAFEIEAPGMTVRSTSGRTARAAIRSNDRLAS